MSAVVDLKTKEEKDAELDKRIEALRKKNEALMKRHQEIEADKKKAEQEGIAVMTSRKPRSHEPDLERRKTEKENLTVTVDLSKPTRESRVVNDRKSVSHHGPEEWDGSRPYGKSPPQRPGSGRLNRGGGISGRGGGHRAERRESHEGDRGEGPPRTDNSRGRRGGRGVTQQSGTNSDRKSKEWEEKRRQNIEKMNEEMEKIAEYERGQRVDGEKNPTRNFLDDPRRSGPIPEMDRKEGSRRHVRNWGGLDFDNVKTGADAEKEWTNRRPSGKSSVDMTMSMTGRERTEYLRWKKEREQIDEERLARHRSATGQWRREWDAQKTEKMFNEDPSMAGEGTPEQNSKREDSRRPPKAPTFGDFLGQSKPREAGRGRGKGRGQGKSYSMHDNRWEAEKEEEKGIKEEQEKEKIKKEDKPSAPAEQQAIVAAEKPVHEGTAEDDDGEWEDFEECETEEEGSTSKTLKKSSSSLAPSTLSPKEKRTPRPKVQIPSAPQDSLTTPEGTKPLSPFTPLEGHHPVSDWGEEMEMLSPKSSLGESPLKFSSNDSSPAQTKSREEECTDDATKPPELVEKQHATQPVPESTAPVIQEKSESSEPADSTSSSSQPTEEPNVQGSGMQNDESAASPLELEQNQDGIPTNSNDQPSSG